MDQNKSQPKQNNYMMNRVQSSNDLNGSNKKQKQEYNQNTKIKNVYGQTVFNKSQLIKKQKKNTNGQVNKEQLDNDRNQQLQKIFRNKKLLKDLIFQN